MLAWKFACLLKGKEPFVVPDKPTNKPFNSSMFFNLFKFEQVRHREPKNVDQHTKKKDKSQN